MSSVGLSEVNGMRIMNRCLLILLVSSLILTIAFVRYEGTLSVRASPSVYQGNLILTGNNVTVIEGQFTINGSIIVENNATLILRNAVVNFTQTSDYQYNMTFQNPTNGNPRLIVENATLMTPHSFFIYFYGNSSCVANDLYVWPAYGTGIWWHLYDSSSLSITDSTVYTVTAYGNSLFEASNCYMRYLSAFGSVSANASSTYVESLTSFNSANVVMTDSTMYNIYTGYGSLVHLVNSTSSTYDFLGTSGVTVSWYLDVKAVDLYGVPLDYVYVTASYSSNTVIESKLTDVNGLARFTLMEKMINATDSYPVGDYYVDADHVSGASAGQTVSITGNQVLTVMLSINAQDYIIIKSDGSITPLTANVTTSDKILYTFTGDNYASIIVDRSNIIINGMGYTVQASGRSGLSLSGMYNVTIENVTIANSGSAINLYGSSSCILSRNNVSGGYGGIYLDYCFNCTVSNNNVTNSGRGVRLQYSSGNVISGNLMTNNSYGNFGVYGYDWSYFVNYIATSNLVNGKPVYYLMNQSNIVVSPLTYPSGVGYLGLFNCKNVTVQDMTLTGNGQGLLLAYTNDSTIISNNIMENGEGVDLYFSPGNVLSGNNITNCTDEGSLVTLFSSPGCIVSGNNITNNYWGSGVLIVFSNCTISGNNLANNYDGVVLSSSSNCAVLGNNITKNSCGINIYSSSGNTFYHNNFINNTQQIYSDGSSNTWDNGYPSGGNYWSDYAGVDLHLGSSQNVVGGDGIGDINCTIGANNVDRYPLIGPLKTFNAGTWNNTLYSVDIISNSTITDFSFNQTHRTITFSVTGVDDSIGFCRVTIPQALMWVGTPDDWIIIVNGTLLTQRYIDESNGHTYIYFNYAHSTETVEIQSTGVIPEFQSLMLLLLFMIATSLGTFILKRKRN